VVSDELIEEIRAQADILQIIGEHVTLRRSGRTYRGPCPLHGGEGPNFSVYPERGLFKCFVCSEGGDVFSFPMKLLGLDFIEAVKFVAERCGISVPDADEARREEDPFRDIREAVAFAADWYQRQLWEEKQGEAARRYLIGGRGLSEEAIKRFGFGLAPDGWRGLREAAAQLEISDDVLTRAGLIRSSERAKEPYDLFRNRLMIPIYNLRSRPIGFGGRTLSDADDAPKYINSPDTPIFHKGRIVYGLDWSRHAIRRKEVVLVVEGFMDLVSLMAAGVENVIAPLGTSLTEHQARLLSRYAKKALLLYDSDKPAWSPPSRRLTSCCGRVCTPALQPCRPAKIPIRSCARVGQRRWRNTRTPPSMCWIARSRFCSGAATWTAAKASGAPSMDCC